MSNMPENFPVLLKQSVGNRLGQAYYRYERQAVPRTDQPVYGEVKIGGPFGTSIGDIWLASFVVRVIITAAGDQGFYVLESFAGDTMAQLRSSFTIAGVCSRVSRISGNDRGRINAPTGPSQYIVEAQHDFEF